MLIGATNNGRDIGPRISGRLGTGLTADRTALDIDDEDRQHGMDKTCIRWKPDGNNYVS